MMDTALPPVTGVVKVADPGHAKGTAAKPAPKEPINLRTSPAAQLVQALPLPTDLPRSSTLGTLLNEVA